MQRLEVRMGDWQYEGTPADYQVWNYLFFVFVFVFKPFNERLRAHSIFFSRVFSFKKIPPLALLFQTIYATGSIFWRDRG